MTKRDDKKLKEAAYKITKAMELLNEVSDNNPEKIDGLSYCCNNLDKILDAISQIE